MVYRRQQADIQSERRSAARGKWELDEWRLQRRWNFYGDDDVSIHCVSKKQDTWFFII